MNHELRWLIKLFGFYKLYAQAQEQTQIVPTPRRSLEEEAKSEYEQKLKAIQAARLRAPAGMSEH